MRAIAFPLTLIIAAVAAFIIYSSTFVVTERDQAVQLRFGQIHRVVEEPGIYFKYPTNFIDTVQIIDRRLLAIQLEDRELQVSDGRRYIVSAFSTFRITNPRAFRESVSGNLTLAAERLRTRFEAALRQVYGRRTYDAALSTQRAQMMVEVRDLVRPEAANLGIDIVDVRIRRTDLLAGVSQQTYERMRSERLAEAAQLRAVGTEQALTIRANADRQATVLIADAQRDANGLRGEGDAERNRILAEATSEDPDFFSFYRSMEAYRTALGSGTGTTMVL
jgi:membrane protease subunit HflC